MNPSEFGKYLKSVRESRGASINQLALYSGVSAAQISRIETGTRGVPKADTIQKLSDALKVPYEEMMKAAGHLQLEDQSNIPSWATSDDRRDFKKLLEHETEIYFDGKPLSTEERERLKRVMEAMFWDEKNKKKK